MLMVHPDTPPKRRATMITSRERIVWSKHPSSNPASVDATRLHRRRDELVGYRGAKDPLLLICESLHREDHACDGSALWARRSCVIVPSGKTSKNASRVTDSRCRGSARFSMTINVEYWPRSNYLVYLRLDKPTGMGYSLLLHSTTCHIDCLFPSRYHFLRGQSITII